MGTLAATRAIRMQYALDQLGGEVGRWLATYDCDVPRALAECRRADWLVRIATTLGAPRRAVVGAAGACAELAVRRVRDVDLRVVRAVAIALAWSRDESSSGAAWAAAFAATQAAEESAESALAREAALAAASACFACDLRADDSYYARRAYAVSAIEHAVRAFGTEEQLGRQRCLEVTRRYLTPAVLASGTRRDGSLPPSPAR